MNKVLQAVRGMNDLLPDATPRWQQVERVAQEILRAYGYREIRLPLLEKTELYARSIGASTDIVEKEMYTFEDRNGDSLTLRPEGTAGCVRAGIEHGLLHNQVQRLWYLGPMFRHERPQKGRYRQFHQIGVEAFGLAGPDIDAELILLTARLWKALGVHTHIDLQLNSLGTAASRAAYRDELVRYLQKHQQRLGEDDQRRLQTNPLRVLDSKDPAAAGLIQGAPSVLDHLDAESRRHFDTLCDYLKQAGLNFHVNPRLVRGLDYYTRTVFEWVAPTLGAQSTVCAGGRYDGLVELLGARPTPAVGFALGLERLLELLAQRGGQVPDAGPQVYVAAAEGTLQAQTLALAESLRDDGLRVELHGGGGSLKSQLKRADRSGALYMILCGPDGRASVKHLRAEVPEEQMPYSAVRSYLQQQLEREKP